MNLFRFRAVCLALLLSISGVRYVAEKPLTLRQPIDIALGQSPEASIVRADSLAAKSAVDLASLASACTRGPIVHELGWLSTGYSRFESDKKQALNRPVSLIS